jgi:MYXO-CTERM domain-containing protein
MKQLFVVFSIAFGLLVTAPVMSVQADSDSGSDSGVAVATSGGGSGTHAAPELDSTVAGSAMVLLLGGVAYLASRRRRDDAA